MPLNSQFARKARRAVGRRDGDGHQVGQEIENLVATPCAEGDETDRRPDPEKHLQPDQARREDRLDDPSAVKRQHREEIDAVKRQEGSGELEKRWRLPNDAERADRGADRDAGQRAAE